MVKFLVFCLVLAFCQISLSLNLDKDILVSFKEGTKSVLDPIKAQSFPNRESRIWAVYNALNEHKDKVQKKVIQFLNQNKISHQSFYISNQIQIKKADSKLIEKLETFPEIGKIENVIVPVYERPVEAEEVPRGILAEWGIETIEATAAWNLGFNGTGAVVGILDSGVRGTHVALAGSYVGSQNNGWFDPESRTQNPVDNNGHGTHVTGSVMGSFDSGVGVAPGAKWLACRCGTNDCTYYLNCAQFLLCPTDANGNNEDCTKAPHIIQNSWGSGQTGNFFNAAMDAWEAAGIVGVFSQGNSGPSCSSANYPGNYEKVIGVGATSSTDNLASFSSKGPVIGTDKIKPDCSAPGQSIRSSYRTSDTSYSVLSGTSMASPHVSGVLALMFGKNKNLTVAEARRILSETTHKTLPATGYTCGGISESEFPNNAHGHGRINALRAVLATP